MSHRNQGYWRWALLGMMVFLVGSSASWAATGGQGGEEVVDTTSTWGTVKRYVGANYNVFFAGPGLPNGDYKNSFTHTPGMNGMPSDTGWNFFGLASLRLKVTPKFGFDLQGRGQAVVTNVAFSRPPDWLRFQGLRWGTFANFLKGETWSFTGALNTELPLGPLMGQMAKQRTQLFNPGLFSFFDWTPKDSKWSVFAMVTPRYWIYRDIDAMAVQDEVSGGLGNKIHWTFQVNPSINYAVNSKTGVRLGITPAVTKYVGLPSPVRDYMPVETGVTYDINEQFSVYPYIYFSTPLDNKLRAQQAEAAGGKVLPWQDSLSFNIWLSGKLF